MIAQDLAALDAILADDAVYPFNCRRTKRGYRDGVRDGLYGYGSIDSDDVSVRCCGDVVIQTGTVQMAVSARVWKRDAPG